MLDSFVRDMRSDRVGLVRAARRAYLLGLVALTLPGAVLGVVLLLTRPAPMPFPAVLALLVLALVLALVALVEVRWAIGLVVPAIPYRGGSGSLSRKASSGAAQRTDRRLLTQGAWTLPGGVETGVRP